MRILEAFEQPQLQFESADSSEVIDEPTAVSSTEDASETDTLSSASGNETKVPAPNVDPSPMDETDQGTLGLGQALPTLLLILGIAIFVIPFIIWLSRRNRTPS